MGFWSREIDVAGLTALPLLEGNRSAVEGEEPYSIADKKARANVLAKYGNDMNAYRMGYIVGFRKEYRKSFDAVQLRSKGFLPATAELKKMDQAKYLAWLQTVATPPPSAVTGTRTGPQTPDSAGRFMLQNAFGTNWSNSTKILTDTEISGDTGDWQYTQTTPVYESETEVSVHLSSLSGFEDKIIITNYTVPPPGRATMSQYTSSGTPGEWYIHVTDAENLPEDVWTAVFIDVSPIIEVKRDNVMNTEKEHVVLAMNDLGIDGNGMWDSLLKTCPPDYVPPPETPNMDCPDEDKIDSTIDNAYILTGVTPDTTDSGVYASIYQWFDTFSDTSGTFSLSMNAMYMNYDFDVEKTTSGGSVTTQGGYTKEITYKDDIQETLDLSPTLIVQYQRTSTSYDTITVSNFNQEWAVIVNDTHWKFTSGLVWNGDPGEDNSKAEARLVLTLDMYNKMFYKDWVPAHETGMVMMAFSVETIKLKWWQTGIFKVVVMAIVTYLSWGSATTFIVNLMNAIINAAISMAIGMMVASIAATLDSELLVAVLFFVAAVAMTMYGNPNMSLLSDFKGYLKLATHAVEAYNQSENIAAAKEFAEDEEKLQEVMDENEDLKELMESKENIHGTAMPVNMDIVSVKNGGILDPETYFYQKYGGQLYDFQSLYDVDGAYDMRKNVKT